jgi:hypothetical protein
MKPPGSVSLVSLSFIASIKLRMKEFLLLTEKTVADFRGGLNKVRYKKKKRGGGGGPTKADCNCVV